MRSIAERIDQCKNSTLDGHWEGHEFTRATAAENVAAAFPAEKCHQTTAKAVYLLAGRWLTRQPLIAAPGITQREDGPLLV
jgi:hypothetical protein